MVERSELLVLGPSRYAEWVPSARSPRECSLPGAGAKLLLISFPLQLAPPARAVVGDDVLEHRGKGRPVDRFVLADGHGAGGLVVMAASDDSLGIRDDAAVVQKYVDVVLRCQ